MTDLDDRIASVLVDLAEVSGGSSLCTISRSGGEVDGTKYQEGRMAALVELRRTERTADALAELTADWRADLVRHREQGSSAGWVAYRAGGVDELERLAEEA